MCHVVSSPVEIKLEKFQEAINDCNHVLSVEPKNVKGTAICIHSHLGMLLETSQVTDLSLKIEICFCFAW